MKAQGMKKGMRRAQGGFTLIELMIVVAIVGILAALAIPAYQDYTVRAQVSEGLSHASAAKVSVAEFYQTNGAYPANNESAGMNTTAANYATDYIQSITVNSGKIEVAYNALGGGAVTAGQKITFSPSTNNAGSLEWDCSQGDVPDQYRPSECR